MTADLIMPHDSNDVRLSEADLKMLAEVDTHIASAIENKDIEDVIYFGRNLIKGFRIRGVVLAKLLYELQSNWNSFGIDDDYYSVITNDMGVKTVTAVKYSNLWRVIFVESGASEKIKQALLGKPIKSLLLLPALIEDGNVDWEEIINADTHEELRNLVREKRGVATSSKTALYIRLDARTGQLFCKQGDSLFTPFGVLNVQASETDPIIAHAIARIVRDARILQ